MYPREIEKGIHRDTRVKFYLSYGEIKPRIQSAKNVWKRKTYRLLKIGSVNGVIKISFHERTVP